MKNLTHSATLPGFFRKMVALIATVGLITLVLMFSAVVFAVLLLAGITAWAYLWWKTRELRKQMRSYSSRSVVMEEVIEGEVIEGESIRVNDPLDKI